MGYVIGSFNLKDFGEKALQVRDLYKIAEIIKNENFDVVALQEIFLYKIQGKDDTNPIEKLKNILGFSWEYEWADAENETGSHEGYAFLWNSNRLRLASDDDGKPFKPRIWKKINKYDIKRRPFYARFTPTDEGGPFFEIRLICIHTYFGNIEKNSNVGWTAKEQREFNHTIRQLEIENVLTKIYPEIEDTVYGKFRPSYTIVLGDYNLRIKKLKGEEDTNNNNVPYLETDENNTVIVEEEWDGWGNAIISDKTKRIVTVQSEFTTLKQQSTTNTDNSEQQEFPGGYANDYDHFSYNVNIERNREVYLNYQRIDAVNKYYNGDFKSYHKNVSDHVPIKMEIELRKD